MDKINLYIDGLSISKELVYAERYNVNQYVIKSIPAFVYGVGYGDVVKLLDTATGEFEVQSRANNITVRLFHNGSLDDSEINSLIDNVILEKGIYEIGKNSTADDSNSLLLISLPLSVGFGKIEELMNSLNDDNNRWEYGNVYSQDGEPLNWWS